MNKSIKDLLKTDFKDHDPDEILALIGIPRNEMKQARKAISVEAAIRYGMGSTDRLKVFLSRHSNDWECCKSFCDRMNTIELMSKIWIDNNFPGHDIGYKKSAEILLSISPDICFIFENFTSSLNNIILYNEKNYFDGKFNIALFIIPIIDGGVFISQDEKVICDIPHFEEFITKFNGDIITKISDKNKILKKYLNNVP